ncbi:MAG: R3H domain-containing nucleic acid-binding protein [bacterium]|nr:R3H domain-containing nucleic acid-binding protein [bacterium]
MERQKNLIKTLITEVIDKMSIEGSVEIMEEVDCPRFVIRTKEAGLLIGEEGKNLMALNSLIKKMADNLLRRDGIEERFVYILDVNDYQAKKIEDVKNEARVNAQRAIYFKREVEMEPMGSYDRRIVHSILSEYPNIKTESVGEEPHRRIIIKLNENVII